MRYHGAEVRLTVGGERARSVLGLVGTVCWPAPGRRANKAMQAMFVQKGNSTSIKDRPIDWAHESMAPPTGNSSISETAKASCGV